MTKKKEKIIERIFTELYAACTTPVDFEILKEESLKNEENITMIPFDDYEIKESIYDEIVERNIKSLRLSKWERQMISATIALGPSPRVIKD